jgi:capsid protein
VGRGQLVGPLEERLVHGAVLEGQEVARELGASIVQLRDGVATVGQEAAAGLELSEVQRQQAAELEREAAGLADYLGAPIVTPEMVVEARDEAEAGASALAPVG